MPGFATYWSGSTLTATLIGSQSGLKLYIYTNDGTLVWEDDRNITTDSINNTTTLVTDISVQNGSYSPLSSGLYKARVYYASGINNVYTAYSNSYYYTAPTTTTTTAAPTTTTTTDAPTTTTTTLPPTTTTTTAAPTTTTTTAAPGQGPVCFLGHAPVATPTGPKRIDSLSEGDLVLTETGKAVPIQRVKVMRCRPGPTTNPYVIAAGQFGATEELLISPRHRVAVGSAMIEARDLGLKQKTMKSPFNYYNIELPGWANMRVAGVEVESLAPAKRVVATVAQVQAAIAALPASQKNAETMKTLKRICQKTSDGKIVVYGSF